jgi:uracil-DNA glycosylase
LFQRCRRVEDRVEQGHSEQADPLKAAPETVVLSRLRSPILAMATLETEARACSVCAGFLPHGTRPVFQIGAAARVLIAGQAPGRKVHRSGIPFDDASGERLRTWMGVDRALFYDRSRIAILPMGFCYPGTGRSGDLAPRPECAPKWRRRMLDAMPSIRLTLVIGDYAQKWHLSDHVGSNLTERVHAWREGPHDVVALPHPSPRNNLWLKRNPWFDEELLPVVQARVLTALAGT